MFSQYYTALGDTPVEDQAEVLGQFAGTLGLGRPDRAKHAMNINDMRKIFIAVVAVGICFGATNLKAEDSPYDCYTLKNFVTSQLGSYKRLNNFSLRLYRMIRIIAKI